MRLIVIAIGVLAVAMVLQLGLLAYSMYALLATIALSRFFADRWSSGLDARRELSKLQVSVGAKIAVVVRVDNRGRLPVPWMLLEDLLPRRALIHSPPPLEVTGDRLVLAAFSSAGSKTMMYQIRCHRRGYYQIGPLIAETGDVFGLYRRYRLLSQPSFLTVLPEVLPLVGFDLASRRPIGEVRMSYRLFEDPTRIRGTREYQPGDALHRIHWRATARTGQLQSKVYEPSTMAGVTLLLDFHKSSYDPADEPVRSELAVTAAASIAGAVAQMQQPIGLCANGRDAADRVVSATWTHGELQSRRQAQRAGVREQINRLRPLVVPTQRGDNQLEQILLTLARLELTDGMTFPQLVHESVQRLSRSATVLAMLSIVTPQHAIALGMLRRRGFAVAAIVNVYDPHRYAEFAGLLIAEGIEVSQLTDRMAIPHLCTTAVVH